MNRLRRLAREHPDAFESITQKAEGRVSEVLEEIAEEEIE